MNGTLASDFKKKYSVKIEEKDLRADEQDAAKNDWFNHFDYQEKTYNPILNKIKAPTIQFQ